MSQLLNDHAEMRGSCLSVPRDQADLLANYSGELDGLVDRLTLMKKSYKIICYEHIKFD